MCYLTGIFTRRETIQANRSLVQNYGSAGMRNVDEKLKPHRQSAHDALGRMDDEQLVVDRLTSGRIAEEVAHAEQHLPPGGAEVQERQRLVQLHVETGIEQPFVARATRERRAEPVQDDDPGRRFGNVSFERG